MNSKLPIIFTFLLTLVGFGAFWLGQEINSGEKKPVLAIPTIVPTITQDISPDSKFAWQDNSALYSCSTDGDCIIVAKNCSSCTWVGGQRTSINQTSQKQWVDGLNKSCRDDRIGMAALSNHESCNLKLQATCDHGRCVLALPKTPNDK